MLFVILASCGFPSKLGWSDKKLYLSRTLPFCLTMPTNPSHSNGVPKEKQVLSEIGNSEKQLWALIHSRGLLHTDSQDLYRKVRSTYERIILNNHTQSELQDVEYSLWKLHYKHIDEFRKIIKKGSGNAENAKSEMPQNGVQRISDDHLNAFKSFLSEATEFYKNLIVKLRKHYGVPEEALFFKSGCISTSVEPDAMLKCQYLCHRCLVCMGDLARYKQQYENPVMQNQNWSVAATHYLEATRIWPDSGNPQNQLAVLATYIGDEFLALYHCVRSLAVKKPFPDAWDNLILLFEKNRSSDLQYVSGEVCFDFLKPSGRSNRKTKAEPKYDNLKCNKFEVESKHFSENKLWALMVRTISFFFIKSSLEEFPIAFASAIKELDEMMELGDVELKNMLESYQQMDSTRRGPFRYLQVVSVLIFVLKNLMDKQEVNEPKDKNDEQHIVLTQLALAATFTFMGRFVERCQKADPLSSCPLLPSVLVFLEWSTSTLDSAEGYATDQKSRNAMSYFFGVFIELINQLNADRRDTKKLPENTPLWEDYELRGFAPVARTHVSLDFSGNWEHIDNFESGVELRTQRIIRAAMKIAGRSNDLHKWITCDELGGKFDVARTDESHDNKETEVESNSTSTKKEDSNKPIHKDEEKQDKQIARDNPNNSSANGKSVAVDEEEVILFRPLTRYNSVPSYPSISTSEQVSPKDKDYQSLPSDECLRRATSLLLAQNPAQTDPWGFHADTPKFRNDKSIKQQEPFMKESSVHTFPEGLISAGPPSLNAWVLDRGSLSNIREKEGNGMSEHRLQPIDELASSSLAGLAINKTEDSFISSVGESSYLHSGHSSSATYSSPAPSAPLLPDNAAWFTDAQSTLPAPLSPDDPARIRGYPDWHSPYRPLVYGPSIPAFMNGYAPPRRMTSSEWLRWYRENYISNSHMQPVNNHLQPTTHFSPSGTPENLLYHDIYRFNQFDQWGNLLSSNHYAYMEPPGPPPLQPGFLSGFGAGEHRTSLYNNFQRQNPYGCGAVTDPRAEPQPLLDYLKEKEWRLQRDPNLGEPTFMGN
ncbi:hypothetical protein L6164_036690 [Bauhinia variegata]|uniref:Uncharacterized protein n=1 Tax=Bauhinia variegata TaxID=167791 RepID=A0ACB9KHZ3_BAUVA|nr:hypothetical protein L6164_036690 [Bauhinia variegata]